MNQQQRAVVQQALEALEVVWREHKAIDGLRQLLEAEPLMEPEGKSKECLTYNGHQEGCSHTPSPAQPAVPLKDWAKQALEMLNDNHHLVAENEKHRYVMMHLDVIKRGKALLEQPADHDVEKAVAYLNGVHTGKKIAKREWVGLTDEEIVSAKFESYDFALNNGSTANKYVIEFASAIEAKLREKNGGAA